MRMILKKLGKHQILFRDTASGIAWVEDGTTGTGHSCHANICASGSVSGMKACGYWSPDDRTAKSHGFTYNLDTFIVSSE